MRTRIIVVAASCFLGAAVDAHGQQLEWIRQIGGTYPPAGNAHDGEDLLSAVASDGLGNVYVGGSVWGRLAGSWQGQWDPYLLKYNNEGDLLWGRQDALSGTNHVGDVAVDATGNVYTLEYDVGLIRVAKHDPLGAVSWRRTLSRPDFGGIYDRSLAIDGDGNTYIAGDTYTGWRTPVADGSQRVFAAKHDAAGVLKWVRQLDSGESDYCYDIALDLSDNIYIAGRTSGSLFAANGASLDAILAKYTRDGELEWGRQIGGVTERDNLLALATDQAGNVYSSGNTYSSLFAPNPSGVANALVTKHSTEGELEWGLQFGDSSGTNATDISVDAQVLLSKAA